MRLRRAHMALALGTLCTAPGVLLVRHVANAQRRHPIAMVTARGASADGAAHAPAARTVHATPIEAPIDGLDPSHARREGGRYVTDLPGARRAVLTVDPAIQRGIATLIAGYQLPRAAVVVLDTDTGRVRAYVSTGEAGAGDLVRDATPPAASVFKVVTSSALIPRGVTESTVTCFDGGGFHTLRERDLAADPRRDRECVTLGQAFGRSLNTVFARRAVERLTPPDLLAAAHAWGFGEAIPFDATTAADPVDVPTATLDFARTSAGFWHSHLAPIHAAVMAQAVARGGEMQRPWVVDSVLDPDGTVVMQGGAHVWRRAVPTDVAATLAHMMSYSVNEGTAFHAFHDAAGRAYLPDVTVGGKTGTLTGDRPYRAYTWFVGNAQNASSRVSFAVMVANAPVWRIKAATLARQVLQIVFHGRATD